jgi:SOS-response transcriptional repressor LexA
MAELVEAVGKLTAKFGYAPTVRELAKEMNVNHHRVHTLATEAERRGRLTRTPRAHRSLRVVEAEGRKGAHR